VSQDDQQLQPDPERGDADRTGQLSLEPDEPPMVPEDRGGLRISRETLLLLGALAFLVVAIALTFLFSPDGDELAQVPTGTTAATLTVATPVGGYPPISDPYPLQSPTLDSYPGPNNGNGQVATSMPEPYPAYPVPEGTPPNFNPTVMSPTPEPTSTPQPTSTPRPTSTPQPTSPPAPTAPPPTRVPTEVLPTPTPTPITPTVPPVDVIAGNVRWSTGESPIELRRDLQLAPGAVLIIEPGVEIRMDPGVSIYVDGARLLALGLPGQPVRFTASGGARWSGMFVNPGSFVVLEHSEISGGGLGGTVLAVDQSTLAIRSSRVFDNGGGIIVSDSPFELRDSEIAGNDMPYGAAVDVSYARGDTVTLLNNRIGGNILSDGAPMVRIASKSTFDTLNLAISGNLIRGGVPNLQLSTNGPLRGDVRCNAFVGDDLGFGLRTQTVQIGVEGVLPMELNVTQNFIDEHVPPIEPVYLKYGLGRGAASEIRLDMRENWWGSASGPYEPDLNPLGRGDSVGNNIDFEPWLTAPPACAPGG
jgi:hypothetical protein